MFTIRRSEKFWSGTRRDIEKEKKIMRAKKTVGGLTHGRGFMDYSLAKWISGM